MSVASSQVMREKHTSVGSTLISLSGGMQKAWVKAEAGSDFFSIPNGFSNCL